jgi:hypothetical protein
MATNQLAAEQVTAGRGPGQSSRKHAGPNPTNADRDGAPVSRSWVVYPVVGLAALRFVPALGGDAWRGGLMGLLMAASLLVVMEAVQEFGVDPGVSMRAMNPRDKAIALAARAALATLALALLAVFIMV